MLNLITTLQLIIFVTYVLYIYRKFGVLTSISASSYELTGMKRWLFFGWLFSLGALNLFQELLGFGFFASCGLIFAGITIDHAEEGAHTKQVHTIGTVLAIIATFVALFLFHGIWVPAVITAGIAIIVRNHKNAIWYIEVTAFLMAILSYYLR